MPEIHPKQFHGLAELILDRLFRDAKLPCHLFDRKVTLTAEFEDELAPGRKLFYFFLEGARQVVEQHAFLGAIVNKCVVMFHDNGPQAHLTMNVVDNTVPGGCVQIHLEALDPDVLASVPQRSEDIRHNFFAHFTRPCTFERCHKNSPPVSPVDVLKSLYISPMKQLCENLIRIRTILTHRVLP